MRILIVEDEAPSARLLKTEIEARVGKQLASINLVRTLMAAEAHIAEHEIDLVFLDLDLMGEDGFEMLARSPMRTFQTIVVSANAHRALEAFSHGVLDFITKPLETQDLDRALARFRAGSSFWQIKALPIEDDGVVMMVPLTNILYFEADRKHSRIFLADGTVMRHGRSLKQLTPLLSGNFLRVHKSYLVRRDAIQGLRSLPDKVYEVLLPDKQRVPVSRTIIRGLKKDLGITVNAN